MKYLILSVFSVSLALAKTPKVVCEKGKSVNEAILKLTKELENYQPKWERDFQYDAANAQDFQILKIREDSFSACVMIKSGPDMTPR